MYRTKTNVFIHRTLLVLFFPSLLCQKTFYITTLCCDGENKYILKIKKCQQKSIKFFKKNANFAKFSIFFTHFVVK